MDAIANNPLKIYSLNVAKVTNNWNEMSEMANVPIDFYHKKGSSKSNITVCNFLDTEDIHPFLNICINRFLISFFENARLGIDKETY